MPAPSKRAANYRRTAQAMKTPYSSRTKKQTRTVDRFVGDKQRRAHEASAKIVAREYPKVRNAKGKTAAQKRAELRARARRVTRSR